MSSISDAIPLRARVGRVPRSKFYIGLSAVMLLIVVVGFSATLYLRSAFDGPQLSLLLLVHGLVMTSWYVGAVIQASLVTGGRTDLHRRLGWGLIVVAAAVLITATLIDFTFVPRRLALGTSIEALVRIVWSDRAALLWFTIFIGAAVALRRNSEMHRHLMLLASISVLQPATSRIWRWPFFVDLSIPPVVLGYSALSLLIIAIGINDVITRRRVHPVTLLGGSLFIATKVFFVFVVARTAFGINTVFAI